MFRCTAYNDCKTLSNEYLLKDIASGNVITDFSGNPFSVYPNPSQGKIILDFSQSTQLCQVQIYSSLGIKVHEQNAAEGIFQVELQPGAYFIHIRSNMDEVVKKILIVQ